ncbi:MAG: hypothetical protein LUC44_07985, partial [Prevotellaceae bacterium]|nr:hypothetical protein [Prevotellaceae bacterium]
IQYLNRMPIADEELFSFFWEYMQARIRDRDDARAESLLRQHFVPEALAKLRQMDEDCECDCLFNGKELSKEYSFETLKCQSKEDGWYDVSFCPDEQSQAEHIFLYVRAEKGVVMITDIKR